MCFKGELRALACNYHMRKEEEMDEQWVKQGIQSILRDIERYEKAHRDNKQGKLSDAELLRTVNYAYREIGTCVIMLYGHGVENIPLKR